MALFLSTYTNKVDKKGRVSVPAHFRTALGQEHFQGIIVYKSFVHDCIEASGMERIEKLSQSIDALDPFSDERDAFATTILGGSVQLPFDGEGRIMLPAELIDEVGISDRVAFVGKGATFEIWQPESLQEYAKNARKLAKEQRAALHIKGNAQLER